MKKVISIIITTVFVLTIVFAFTSCANNKEKATAETTVETTKEQSTVATTKPKSNNNKKSESEKYIEKEIPSLMKFIEKHYPNAEIKDYEFPVYGDFIQGYKPGDFIQVKLSENGKSFYIISDKQGEQFYTADTRSDILEDLRKYVVNLIGLDSPYKVEVAYYDSVFEKYSKYDIKCFIPSDITTFDELIKEGNFNISVAISYIDSKSDFKKLNLGKLYSNYFLLKNIKFDIAILNYRGQSYFSDGNIIENAKFYEMFRDVTDYYCLNDVRTVCTYDNDKIIDLYYHYNRKEYNGVEYAWDSTYNLDFSKSAAPKSVVTTSNEKYNSTDKQQTVINCNRTSEYYYPGSKICMYFPLEKFNSEFIIQKDNEIATYTVDDVMYDYFSHVIELNDEDINCNYKIFSAEKAKQ